MQSRILRGKQGKLSAQHACNTVVSVLQEYAVQRCNDQEAAYNLGRAAHQLELLHIAVPFYERALATQPPVDSSVTNLHREAAHNLVLIYRKTGAIELARQIMRKHLIY